MATYRRCRKCGEYYSDKPPLTPNPYCPLCFPKQKKYLVKKLKKGRYVPMDYFNLYTDAMKFKNGAYGHACRLCGRLLLTKKKKPSRLRYCSKCDAYDLFGKYDMSTINYNLYKTQNTCEICGKETDTPEVHHKVPVHTLNWSNIHLIWDPGNLQLLCHGCHVQQPHYRKVKNLAADAGSQQKISDFW